MPFTGKLSMSWPRVISQIPVNAGDTTYDPLLPYGWGLRTGSPDGSPRTAAILATVSGCAPAGWQALFAEAEPALDSGDAPSRQPVPPGVLAWRSDDHRMACR